MPLRTDRLIARTFDMRLPLAVMAATMAGAAALSAFPVGAQQGGSTQSLLQELRDARQQEAQRDQQRIEDFLEQVNERQAMLAEARQARDAARARRDELQTAFDGNEDRLAELETHRSSTE